METNLLLYSIVFLVYNTQIYIECTAVQETYTVVINNSGPAVIDSVITFTATLNKLHHNSTQEPVNNGTNQSQYLYTWMTNACLDSKRPFICNENITSNESAVLERVYSKFDVQHGGEYLMTVVVHEHINSSYVQIVTNSSNFILTDTINGELSISQNVTKNSQKSANTFSTFGNITFTAVITDHFTKPILTSVWYIIGPGVNITHQLFGLSYSLLLPDSGRYKVFVAVIVHVPVVDQQGKEHLVERNTSFSGHLLMKDPVSKVSLVGSNTYTVGANLSADVVCLGSPPFYLSLTLIDPEQSVIQEVEDTSSSCHFHVTQPFLDITGTYSLNVTIENDVSRVNNVINIHVIKEPPPGYGVIVPFFSVIISILAPGAILYAYLLDRRRQRSIEYADFSFRDERYKARHQHGFVNKMLNTVKLAGGRICGGDSKQSDKGSENNNICGVKMKTLTGSYEAIV